MVFQNWQLCRSTADEIHENCFGSRESSLNWKFVNPLTLLPHLLGLSTYKFLYKPFLWSRQAGERNVTVRNGKYPFQVLRVYLVNFLFVCRKLYYSSPWFLSKYRVGKCIALLLYKIGLVTIPNRRIVLGTIWLLIQFYLLMTWCH